MLVRAARKMIKKERKMPTKASSKPKRPAEPIQAVPQHQKENMANGQSTGNMSAIAAHSGKGRALEACGQGTGRFNFNTDFPALVASLNCTEQHPSWGPSQAYSPAVNASSRSDQGKRKRGGPDHAQENVKTKKPAQTARVLTIPRPRPQASALRPLLPAAASGDRQPLANRTEAPQEVHEYDQENNNI